MPGSRFQRLRLGRRARPARSSAARRQLLAADGDDPALDGGGPETAAGDRSGGQRHPAPGAGVQALDGPRGCRRGRGRRARRCGRPITALARCSRATVSSGPAASSGPGGARRPGPGSAAAPLVDAADGEQALADGDQVVGGAWEARRGQRSPTSRSPGRSAAGRRSRRRGPGSRHARRARPPWAATAGWLTATGIGAASVQRAGRDLVARHLVRGVERRQRSRRPRR